MNERKKTSHSILYLTAILLATIALWGAKESGTRTDLRMRRELARQAASIAASLPIAEVEALSFTIDDQNRPEYHRLCNSLKAYAQTTGLRSVYTITRRGDGALVFGPESLEREDIYASPPGDVYQQPQQKNFELFETATPFTTGPYTDEFGAFVSASAPIIHPQTGRVLMSLGIDVEAGTWKKSIRRAQWTPVLLAIIPLGLLALTAILLKVRPRIVARTPERPHHLEPVACAVIMLLLTAAATWVFYTSENSVREESFHTTALLKAEVYANELKNLNHDIETLTAFFNASDFVDAEEFKTFCEKTINHQASEGLAWCPEVPVSNLKEFEQQQRAGGLPEFSVRALPGAEGSFDIAYPALYVVAAEHVNAQGYDVYSEPRRRVAIDEAIRTGQATATATATINLVALPDQPNGFFIFKSVSTSRQKGVLSTAVHPQRMMQRLGQRTAAGSAGLSICLLEIHPGEQPELLAHSHNNKQCPTLNFPVKKLHRIVPLLSFGRTYTLLITPNAQWYKTHPLRNWKIALFAGLTLTGLLTGLISILTNRPILLEKQVRNRTAELLRSEKRFRDLIDTLPDLIWLKDPDGVYLLCNRRFEQLFGATEEEIKGKTDYDFVDRELADLFRENDRQAIEKDGTSTNEEWVPFASDGHKELLETVKTPLYDENNQLIGVLGIARDITERKLAKQALEESEKKLRGIIENSTNMFYSHTPDHMLTYVSPQVRDILGYEVEEALKRWTDMASDHPANERGLQLTQEAIRTGKAQPTYELQLLHKDGHPFWVEVREAPSVENGKTVAITGSLTDITARKAAEEDLLSRNEELERFNKASVGRELRMIELKQEINTLCRELGKPESYALNSMQDNMETSA